MDNYIETEWNIPIETFQNNKKRKQETPQQTQAAERNQLCNLIATRILWTLLLAGKIMRKFSRKLENPLKSSVPELE